MFRRQDQEKLLKYLSKSNSTAANKNVILSSKPSKPVPSTSTSISEPVNKTRQHVDIVGEMPASTKGKRKPDSLTQDGDKFGKTNKRQKKQFQKNDLQTLESKVQPPKKIANMKAEQNMKNNNNKDKDGNKNKNNNNQKKDNKNKKNKKAQKGKNKQDNKEDDKIPEVKAPISEKKAAKIKKQNDSDEKLMLEVKKMYDIFKKEAETGTETVEDIENDILENEGFVEDDNDGVEEAKTEEEIRSKDVGNKAKQRLAVSMFRSMNEYLYTHSSGESRQNFTANKFKLYHEAYDSLMEDWPVKPVDYLIDILKSKIGENKLSETTIADIGCGSRPQIAEAFPEATVHSYDLYQNDLTDSRIISADMCRLPLDSSVCDYAVYSLSLMPTNLREAIKESNRILKMNGHLMIVEVASRFADFQGQGRVQNVPEKHVGQRFAKELKHFGFQLVSNEELKPNGYFVYFCFKKIGSVENVHKNQLPELTLKACVYKPR